MSRKLRVIVCGSTFGRFYIEALKRNIEEFELVGIVARGSKRSKQCAEELGVPLFTEIEQIPKDIDLACVVLRSGVLGGNGSLLAKELLNRNINVIQEQPIHKSDMTECIRIARKNKLVFMTCDLYVHLPAVKAFIESAAKLLKQQKALYIEASCSTQVSYPLIDILSQIFHTMKPWSINFVNRESGPFHVATGKISDIPVIYQINNEIDPDDPDNYMHLLQKITIGTEGGHLALEDTHGPVIWYPRLHVPVSMYNDKGHLVNYPVHLNENVCDFLYDEPDSFIRTLREKWPDAIAEDLLKVASMIRGECNSLPSFQKELTVSTLWHDLTQKVGFADLVKGTGHEAVYSIDLVPEKDLIRFANSKNLDISDSGSVAEELIKEITVEDIRGYLKDIKIAVCYSILNLLQVDGQKIQNMSKANMINRLQILPQYENILERWLKLLLEEGFLEEENSNIYNSRFRTDASVCEKQWETVKKRWNNKLGSPLVMAYLTSNVNNLKKLLNGEVKATHLLFPEGKMMYAEALYKETVTTRYLNKVFAEAIRRISYVLKLSQNIKSVNILEVGAGTGATTESILQMFSGKDNLKVEHYIFTDVSNFFLAEAKQKFSKYKQLEYKYLNIDSDPRKQGFCNEDYDIIIAAGVLNNAVDLERTIGYLMSMLKPGGYILISEPIREFPEILVSQAFMVMIPEDTRYEDNKTFLDGIQWRDLILSNTEVEELIEVPKIGHKMEAFGQKLFIVRKKWRENEC